MTTDFEFMCPLLKGACIGSNCAMSIGDPIKNSDGEVKGLISYCSVAVIANHMTVSSTIIHPTYKEVMDDYQD